MGIITWTRKKYAFCVLALIYQPEPRKFWVNWVSCQTLSLTTLARLQSDLIATKPALFCLLCLLGSRVKRKCHFPVNQGHEWQSKEWEQGPGYFLKSIFSSVGSSAVKGGVREESAFRVLVGGTPSWRILRCTSKAEELSRWRSSALLLCCSLSHTVQRVWMLID